MKSIYKYALFFVLTITSIVSDGQEYSTKRKVISILPEQSFYLNGGVRASFGGKSRVFYVIDLPKNTLGWVYSFSTSTNDRGRNNLKLAAQLTKLIDPTGMTETAVETVLAPSGVSSADIYLCDKQNIDLFMQKADNNGHPIRYFATGSRENYRQGVVPVKMKGGGLYYLGIKNPEEVDGINVNLEVVAIVEEKTLVQQTPEQEKAKLYGSLGWNAFTENSYAKCEEYCKKALEYDGSAPWIKCNLALCYLVQNKPESVDVYIDAIASCKKSDNPKAYLVAAIKDINDAVVKLGLLPNAADILNLLHSELNRIQK